MRSRGRLTQQSIFAAALALIDEEGLPALNMRRLGAAMGVDPMALYRHLPNKQAILAGVVDLVLADLAEDSTGSAHDRVYAFFLSLRHVLAAHPNAIPLVANSSLRTGLTSERAERLLVAMQESGLSNERALDAFYALQGFALGYAWLEVRGFVGELPDSAAFVRSNIPPSALESASLGAASSSTRDLNAGQGRFERCLRAILESLLPR